MNADQKCICLIGVHSRLSAANLLISFRVDPDLHSLQDLQILFSEIEVGGVRRALIVSGVRPQPDLKPERQFHLVTSFPQALDSLGNLRRILDRLVNRGADLANDLFGVVIDFHSLLCYASRRRLPTPNRQFTFGNVRLSAMFGSIGILTGGGDAPGLNAVIRAVVKTATCEYGMRVIGIEDGFEGLLGETRTRMLSSGDVRGLLPRGGTILGTRNRGRFVETACGDSERDAESVYQEAISNMKIVGIDALVVLGGEGTLTIAEEFNKRGVPVCGVRSEEHTSEL